MNCKYCNDLLKTIYHETRSATVFEDLMCESCHVHYEFIMVDLEEPLLHAVTFYDIKIRDREFEVKFLIGEKKTSVFRLSWRMQQGKGTFQMPVRKRETIHTFNQLTNWDPFNVKEKLELLLPFI